MDDAVADDAVDTCPRWPGRSSLNSPFCLDEFSDLVVMAHWHDESLISNRRSSTTSQPVLLGVNAGLQPELSGLANARLGLLAMGFAPEELDHRTSGVIEQADLGRAIHRPMKTYSSGMAARLRFAIATASEPEILLIDEALAAGDAASRDRAEHRMEEIRERAGTVFLVTHSGQMVEETCSRAIWLHDGVVVQDGPAIETAQAYRWWAWNVAQGKPDVAAELLAKAFAAAGASHPSP